jgi:hypothetical protein
MSYEETLKRMAELKKHGTPESPFKQLLELTPETLEKMKKMRAKLGIPEPVPERSFMTDGRIETLADLDLARKNKSNWRSPASC